MHETDNIGLNPGDSSDSDWQAPRTEEEYYLLNGRRHELLSLKRLSVITPTEAEELVRLEGLSKDYVDGVVSMFKDLFTGEGGRRYDLRSSGDRAEMAEKLRVFREGPRSTTDIGGAPILPPQATSESN